MSNHAPSTTMPPISGEPVTEPWTRERLEALAAHVHGRNDSGKWSRFAAYAEGIGEKVSCSRARTLLYRGDPITPRMAESLNQVAFASGFLTFQGNAQDETADDDPAQSNMATAEPEVLATTTAAIPIAPPAVVAAEIGGGDCSPKWSVARLNSLAIHLNDGRRARCAGALRRAFVAAGGDVNATTVSCWLNKGVHPGPRSAAILDRIEASLAATFDPDETGDDRAHGLWFEEGAGMSCAAVPSVASPSAHDPSEPGPSDLDPSGIGPDDGSDGQRWTFEHLRALAMHANDGRWHGSMKRLGERAAEIAEANGDDPEHFNRSIHAAHDRLHRGRRLPRSLSPVLDQVAEALGFAPECAPVPLYWTGSRVSVLARSIGGGQLSDGLARLSAILERIGHHVDPLLLMIATRPRNAKRLLSRDWQVRLNAVERMALTRKIPIKPSPYAREWTPERIADLATRLNSGETWGRGRVLTRRLNASGYKVTSAAVHMWIGGRMSPRREAASYLTAIEAGLNAETAIDAEPETQET